MNGFCDSSRPSSTLVGRERTWAVMRSPSSLASSISAISSRQPSGRASDCSIVMVTGRLDSFASRRNRPISPSWVLEVRDDLHPAGARLAHGMGDRRQLRLLGAQGRDAAAVGGAMVERARRREAERAGAQAFGGERGHAPAILVGGRLAVGAALAHHIDAQRRVRHLGRDVGVVATARRWRREIREALPVPRQAFAQHDLGNVLHALHQVDQQVVLVRPAGREADAAIAEQHRRRAVP